MVHMNKGSLQMQTIKTQLFKGWNVPYNMPFVTEPKQK